MLINEVIKEAKEYKTETEEEDVRVGLESLAYKVARSTQACETAPDFDLTAYYARLGFVSTGHEDDMEMHV